MLETLNLPTELDTGTNPHETHPCGAQLVNSNWGNSKQSQIKKSGFPGPLGGGGEIIGGGVAGSISIVK